jgi:hypothetical protein
MYQLPKVLPDPEVLLGLQPEELAAKLLFLLQDRVRQEKGWSPHLGNIQTEPFGRRK